MKLEDTIKSLQEKYNLTGVQILTMKNGHTHTNISVGYSSMISNKLLENSDLFRIASISKLLVAICMMKAKEEGLVNLDTDISQYLGFPLVNPHHIETPITIRQLLSHTSSLTDSIATSVPLGTHIKELVSPGGSMFSEKLFLVKEDDYVKPGTTFEYCNIAFGVLATILEIVFNERFDICVKNKILIKLDMKGSFNVTDLDHKLVKPLYRYINDSWNEEVDGNEFLEKQKKIDYSTYQIGTNGTLFGPQGGFRTNATELAKLMYMFVSEENQVLKRDSIIEMCTLEYKNTLFPEDKEKFVRNSGLGPNIIFPSDKNKFVLNQTKTLIGHTGLAYGFMGLFFFDFESKNGMIVLSLGHKEPMSNYTGKYSTYFDFQEEIGSLLYKQIFE